MIRETQTLTYNDNMSRNEMFRVFKAIGFPLAVFAFGLFVISNFANFGTKMICPAAGLMWAMGLLTAIILPSMRREILDQTLKFCLAYFAAMVGFKMALGIVSGVSAEMIAASYNQSITTAGGNAMPGAINNMMMFSSFLTPLGQIAMQGKRLIQFQRHKSLSKTLTQTRDVRNRSQSYERRK